MRSESDNGKLLLSMNETAQLLGVSARTVWNITQPRGDLPCVRIGQGRKPRVLYSRKTLETWVAGKAGTAA